MAEFMYADRIPAEILAWGNELAQIRRDIHQHPELGFDTSRTCGVIATKLSEWGVEFDDKLVEGGVIAVVNGNAPGPTVALRADMDALAMPDESENAWRSETSQRCHACGHDGHVTWLLGAVRALHAHPDFPGRVSKAASSAFFSRPKKSAEAPEAFLPPACWKNISLLKFTALTLRRFFRRDRSVFRLARFRLPVTFSTSRSKAAARTLRGRIRRSTPSRRLLSFRNPSRRSFRAK